ncbi:hypothetical protein [Microseira sp. BLCC-F43]|uniref:hypothetical protein n=1 Tax=Microseira sp. BLCC-F43 TaxID=3153602 RepID=UPI0035B95D80
MLNRNVGQVSRWADGKVGSRGYGDGGDEADEADSGSGSNFLADLRQETRFLGVSPDHLHHLLHLPHLPIFPAHQHKSSLSPNKSQKFKPELELLTHLVGESDDLAAFT